MKWWVAVLCELMLLAAASSNEECKEPLAMANGHINQIKASTIKDDQHLAHSAQSKTDEAWCSRSDDPSPYLEISLKDTYRITSITTRGSIRDPRAWVRTYHIRYNTTSSGWVVFSNKTFPGNAHFVRPRTNDFRPAILSNAIRIYPKEVQNFACLKVELHGCLFKSSCSDPGSPNNGAKIGSDFGHGKQIQFVCVPGFSIVGSAVATCIDGRWSAFAPACEECKETLGMANGHINQIKASTTKDDQHLAHSAQSKTDEAWCSRSDDPSPYLEISLKDTYRITSITTRGSIRDPRAWVRTYQIRYNTTSSGWVVFSNKIFSGNAHFLRPRTNDFRPAILSNAIRIYPKEVHSFACLKVELSGCLFEHTNQ